MLFKLISEDEKHIEPIRISSLQDAGWIEKDLENVLAKNITNLIQEEHLMIVSQERPRQEEPDILAIDKDGVLHIFELKRTISDPENILQVLKYGQRFGTYDYEQLNSKYQKFETRRIKDLQKDHREYFNLDYQLEKKEYNNTQKFIVVTNGIDFKTLRSIKYWQEHGLPIEPLIYRIYQIGQEFVMDFNPYSGKDDELSYVETSNHIVNTNRSYRPKAYKEMIEGKKAAAYGGRKNAIDSIEKNDRVLLYHKGVGICAVGRVTSENARERENGHERYVECAFTKTIDPEKEPDRALSAREINSKLGTKLSFRQTRFSISDVEADIIEKMFKNKK